VDGMEGYVKKVMMQRERAMERRSQVRQANYIKSFFLSEKTNTAYKYGIKNKREKSFQTLKRISGITIKSMFDLLESNTNIG
jgi:hypothetical protein